MNPETFILNRISNGAMNQEKFKKGDVVYFHPAPTTWIKVAIDGERFNGGNDRYYDIRYINNGRCRTVSGEFLTRMKDSQA